MAKIKFLRAGTYTTIQDLGRKDFLEIGVSKSGCLDFRLMYIANALLMNELSKSCLEFIFTGPKIEIVEGKTQVAIAGDFTFNIIKNNKIIEGIAYRTYTLDKKDIIDIHSSKNKIIGYLSFKNVLGADLILNSQSMNKKFKIGHNNGQPFKDNDTLRLDDCDIPNSEYQFLQSPLFVERKTIRAFPGPQYSLFKNKETIFNNEFQISNSRDRVGILLEGPLLHKKEENIDFLSQPTVEGVIQVHTNGKCFLMCSDKPPCGGYPNVAVVSKCDYFDLLQMPSHRKIKFELAEYKEMNTEYRKFKKLLLKMCHSDNLKKI